ncbi:MAG: helix-turn-helix domain-containing protein [Nannocystaceae bacterium]
MGLEVIEGIERRLAEFAGDLDPEDPKGLRRRRILEAATQLFATRGYRRTSISEIAKEAGIAKGTVYLYFATKVELLLATTGWEKLKAMAAFRELYAREMTPRERLRGWVTATLLTVARSPLLARLVEGDDEFNAALADLPAGLLAESYALQYQLFGRLVAEATGESDIDPAELRERITALSSIFHVAPRLRADHLRQGMTMEALASKIAGLVVDGIDPQGA